MVQKSDVKGILLMIGASLSFSIMGVFSKLALQNINVWELVFFRGMITLLIMFILIQTASPNTLGPSGSSPTRDASERLLSLRLNRSWRRLFFSNGIMWNALRKLRGENWKLLVARGLFGSMGLICYMYTIKHLKFADAVILNRASPFFVILLAPILLSEKITRAHVIAMLAGFGGVYHIIKPDLHIQVVPGAVGLLSAVFAGLAYVCVKKLTGRHSSRLIVFYFSLVSMLLPVPFLFSSFKLPDSQTFLYVLMVGLTASLAQILMTQAYRLAPAGKVSIASYTNVIFAAFLGVLLFSEIQDMRAILGSILIVASCLSLPFIGRKTLTRKERM